MAMFHARWCAVALATALVTYAAAAGLEGRVLEDHTGSPLASASVRIFQPGVRNLAADLDTDSEGRFHAPSLAAGDYRVEVSKPNYTGAVLRVTVAEEKTTLVVRLVRCGVIGGQVLDQQGKPVRGARIFAMPEPADGGPFQPPSGRAQGHTAAVDDRGEYRLYNLAPGRYAVAVTYGASSSTVVSSGGAIVSAGVGSGAMFYPANSRPQVFTISGGEEFRGVNFTVLPNSLFTVAGRVELPAPKDRFWVALTPADQPVFATAVAQADDEGKFRLEGVQAGSYFLFATGPSNARGGRGAILGGSPFYARTRVDVAGQNVADLVIAVRQGRGASFILRAASTAAGSFCPASARLTLWPLEDWSANIDRTVEINTTKETVVDDLAPARYHIAVSNLGDTCYPGANGVLDLTGAADSRPYAVLVAPAGSIRGKLTGAARPADFVVALVAADAVEGVEPLLVALPDAGSKFTFGGLRPGHYRIAAQPAADPKARWVSDMAKMFDIEVPGGAPTELDLPSPVKR